MPRLFPLTSKEKVIITARTLPSLLEGGVPPFGEELPQLAAFYVKKGILSAIRLIPAEMANHLSQPGWRSVSLPVRQLLVPSFVDCHLHLALDGVEGFRSLSAPCSSPQLLTRLRSLAAAGVLAVRDGGDRFSSAFAAQELSSEKKGGIGPLPKIMATGIALFRHGHYGVMLGGKGLDGMDQLENEITRRKEAGAQQLKVILSGLVSLTDPGKVGPLQFSLSELQEIVSLAGAYDLPVMAHASSDAAVRLAVKAGVHSVEHGYFVAVETLKEMAGTGVSWVPTLAPLAALAGRGMLTDRETHAVTKDRAVTKQATTAEPSLDSLSTPEAVLNFIVARHLRMIARAHELGVTMGVGTDGGAPGVTWSGGYWMELALLARAQFSPQELLNLATVNGAKLLGLERERGHIAVGKPPNWLCLDMDFLKGQLERKTLKGIIYIADTC